MSDLAELRSVDAVEPEIVPCGWCDQPMVSPYSAAAPDADAPVGTVLFRAGEATFSHHGDCAEHLLESGWHR